LNFICEQSKKYLFGYLELSLLVDMILLLLTRYSNEAASSRYRFYQYAEYFRAQGVDIIIKPLFDDRYVKNISKYGNQQYLNVISSYLNRIFLLVTNQDHDLIFIEKELLPWIPYELEYLLIRSHSPYVLDYDDGIFHNYDLSTNPWIKKVLGQKIDLLMKHSAMVIGGSPYLVNRAIQAGAPRVELLPTVIDLDKYPIAARLTNDTFTIGWIGSPTTTPYLESLAPVFQSICANGKARVVAIGAKDFQIEGVDLQIKKWSEETEISDLNQIDVGIMPLDDTPWSRGKCGFKLIQYMACAKPVIASPVGINTEIVEDGVNGFLASTDQEWINSLSKLRDNWELQKKMGENGRKKVEEQYCLGVTAPKLLELLKSVAKDC
jgi:glycosyltransferase involved in cell wall biosynthesis